MVVNSSLVHVLVKHVEKLTQEYGDRLPPEYRVGLLAVKISCSFNNQIPTGTVVEITGINTISENGIEDYYHSHLDVKWTEKITYNGTHPDKFWHYGHFAVLPDNEEDLAMLLLAYI